MADEQFDLREPERDMSDSVDTKVWCPNCEEQIEVAIHPGSDAVFSRTDTRRNCDEQPPFFVPEECGCGWPIEIENAGEIYRETREAAEEDHLEAQAELRREMEREDY